MIPNSSSLLFISLIELLISSYFADVYFTSSILARFTYASFLTVASIISSSSIIIVEIPLVM